MRRREGRKKRRRPKSRMRIWIRAKTTKTKTTKTKTTKTKTM
jgi:hypothetical protein